VYVGPDLSSFLSKQFKDAPIILHLLNWSAFLDYVSFVFVEFHVVLWVYFVLNGLRLVSYYSFSS
jgi:hypothetical protein